MEEQAAQGLTLGIIAFYLLISIVCLWIYFLPAYLAFKKDHPNRWPIFILNFLFGGTGIAWLGCLIWALKKVHDPIDTNSTPNTSGGESGINLFANDSAQIKEVSSQVTPVQDETSNPSSSDSIERLEKLFELKSKGAITEEEYQKQKDGLLGDNTQTQPTIATPQVVPFNGKQFIAAKCPSSLSKNAYDFINVQTGKIALKAREGNMGAGTKLARMGTLAVLSKFSVALSLIDDSPQMHLQGGGMGGHAEAFDSQGQKLGEIKRTSKMNLDFEAFDENGSLFKVKAKGMGVLASKFPLLRDGVQIGLIKDISDREAKKILGGKFRMLDSKYDYAFSIDLDEDMNDKAKIFLCAATYQLAHVMGRI